MGAAPVTVRRRRSAVIVLFVVLTFITAAAASQVWTKLRVIDYGYKISRATRRQAELKEINRRLKVEIALLKNPARIARIAEQQLGMQPPTPEQVRRLRLRAPDHGPAEREPSVQQLARAR